METKGLLRNIYLFYRFSDDQLDEIARFVSVVKVKKGSVIFIQDRPATAFYGVLFGRLSVYRSSSIGAEQVLHYVENGDLVAEAAIFGTKNYPANCKVLQDAMLVKIPKDAFTRYLLSHPDACLNMMAGYSSRLREFVTMIEYLSLDDVRLRILKYFQKQLTNIGNNEVGVKLSISKKELAGILGTSPESISRNLKKMKDNQQIIEHDGIIKICNPSVFFTDLLT